MPRKVPRGRQARPRSAQGPRKRSRKAPEQGQEEQFFKIQKQIRKCRNQDVNANHGRKLRARTDHALGSTQAAAQRPAQRSTQGARYLLWYTRCAFTVSVPRSNPIALNTLQTSEHVSRDFVRTLSHFLGCVEVRQAQGQQMPDRRTS
jgi:hypothetical protein